MYKMHTSCIQKVRKHLPFTINQLIVYACLFQEEDLDRDLKHVTAQVFLAENLQEFPCIRSLMVRAFLQLQFIS